MATNETTTIPQPSVLIDEARTLVTIGALVRFERRTYRVTKVWRARVSLVNVKTAKTHELFICPNGTPIDPSDAYQFLTVDQFAACRIGAGR